MLGQNGSITVNETTDFRLQSGKIGNLAGRHLHYNFQIGCALAMTGVISCGRDHHGKVAQKTVGPSKCLHHTLTVQLFFVQPPPRWSRPPEITSIMANAQQQITIVLLWHGYHTVVILI